MLCGFACGAGERPAGDSDRTGGSEEWFSYDSIDLTPGYRSIGDVELLVGAWIVIALGDHAAIWVDAHDSMYDHLSSLLRITIDDYATLPEGVGLEGFSRSIIYDRFFVRECRDHAVSCDEAYR